MENKTKSSQILRDSERVKLVGSVLGDLVQPIMKGGLFI